MAKVIMVQGTASGVGKSLLATALCRIFTQDGNKTAPFKAQNMTTVCHTLPDGRMMARSQAVAAYACDSEPDPDMNPVLLKMGEGGTEVIVNGRSMGVLSREAFRQCKADAFTQVLAAFYRLCETHDVVVIEGAGSPVELNLNQGDMVNMGLATAVQAPVLLVSDILRGGVFAALYGTVALLSEEERSLIKGLVVNKFKGDASLFTEGIHILEDLCAAPVLGVIPFRAFDLEDEDSLSEGEMKTKESLEKEIGAAEYTAYQQSEFDEAAAFFRANLNMIQVYKIMEKSRNMDNMK